MTGARTATPSEILSSATCTKGVAMRPHFAIRGEA